MYTLLDWIIIIFMVLAVASLLAICLMFLVKNQRVRKICFYLVVALGLYAATIGVRIGQYFFHQLVLAVLFGLVSVAALVLERVGKGDEKKFLIARILATVAAVLGIINAFS